MLTCTLSLSVPCHPAAAAESLLVTGSTVGDGDDSRGLGGDGAGGGAGVGGKRHSAASLGGSGPVTGLGGSARSLVDVDHSDIEVDSLGDEEEAGAVRATVVTPVVTPAATVPAPALGDRGNSNSNSSDGAGGGKLVAAPGEGKDGDTSDDAASAADSALVDAHREQIHEMMDLVKAVRCGSLHCVAHLTLAVCDVGNQEMRLLSERDRGVTRKGEYIDLVDSLLSKKLALIMNLKAKLQRYRMADDAGTK